MQIKWGLLFHILLASASAGLVALIIKLISLNFGVLYVVCLISLIVIFESANTFSKIEKQYERVNGIDYTENGLIDDDDDLFF